jgi:hypothetical protein
MEFGMADGTIFPGKWKNFTDDEARGLITRADEAVAGFPLRYVWHTGPWYDIFQMQIGKIRRDIRRAKAEDRLALYLSCPISSRGGGYAMTNVDVALHVERALMEKWGEGFWILNPAQYQMESKGGTGLISEHAEYLGIDLERLTRLATPEGGDYMRMWTTVLVENDTTVGVRTIDPKFVNTGQNFDAFYFLGPRDVHSFFLASGETLTAGIHAYFARKFAFDADFRAKYDETDRVKWTISRLDFFRYYSLKASANFSLGSHDEWLIFRTLNALRRDKSKDPGKFMIDGNVGDQIAGFFDGVQIDPASTETGVSRGYAQ